MYQLISTNHLIDHLKKKKIKELVEIDISASIKM
jgi:hypothetical protein